MGHRRAAGSATVGEIVICVDRACQHDVDLPFPTKFVGLVLDKSATIYKILVLDTGQERYWPVTSTYLWKETK
jgi:hypothetical protein